MPKGGNAKKNKRAKQKCDKSVIAARAEDAVKPVRRQRGGKAAHGHKAQRA